MNTGRRLVLSLRGAVLMSGLLLIACGGEESASGTPTVAPPILPSLPTSDTFEPEDDWKEFAVPPTSLGPGFVDLSGPILEPGGMEVSAGDKEANIFPDRTATLFGDVDADGNPEVIVGNLSWNLTTKAPRVFRFNPETETLLYDSVLTEKLHQVSGMIAAVVDLDGDTIPDAIGMTADKGIGFGTGDGNFEDFHALKTPPSYPTDFRPNGAVHLADIDRDGWLDILLGDGLCSEGAQTLNILLRTGLRTYESRMDLATPQSPVGAAYAVFAGPIGHTEMGLYSGGGACSNASPNEPVFLESGLGSDGYPRFEATEVTPFESEYKTASAVSFGPLTLARPMAMASTDVDGDGHLDFITTLSEYYAFFKGGESFPFEDRTATSGIVPPNSDTGRPMIPWGMAMLDLDKDGLAEFVVTHGSGEDTTFLEGPLAIGPQHTTVYWNAGDFHFLDITELTGLKEPGNWRALTFGDLNRDGAPDLALGGLGLHPRVYLNRIEVENNGFALELRGTTSNHLGIGAKVEVLSEDLLTSRVQVMGETSSPLATSAPMLFVGTGKATEATVRITWPSGFTQEIPGVEAEGIQLIEEPPTLLLSSETRTVFLEEDPLVVSVFPRASDGSIRDAESVEIALAFGEGTWMGPTEKIDDGSYQRILGAPSNPGYAVVEATIDGEAIRIRPRVWWKEASP